MFFVLKKGEGYFEEPVRFGIGISVLLCAVVAGLLYREVGRVGARGQRAFASMGRDTFVAQVDADANRIRKKINRAGIDEELLAQTSARSLASFVQKEREVQRKEKAVRADPEGLLLTGIFWNPNRPVVSVNGKGYFEGQAVGGYLIEKIERHEVYFISPDGFRVFLNLNKAPATLQLVPEEERTVFRRERAP